MFIVVPPKNLKLSSELNVRVMRRVRLVYYTRKVLNPVVIEFFSLFVMALATAKFVSVGKVVKNSPAMNDLVASGQFWSEAWSGAELPAQGLFLAILFLSIILLAQGFKTLKSSFLHNRAGSSKMDKLLVEKGIRL